MNNRAEPSGVRHLLASLYGEKDVGVSGEPRQLVKGLGEVTRVRRLGTKRRERDQIISLT